MTNAVIHICRILRDPRFEICTVKAMILGSGWCLNLLSWTEQRSTSSDIVSKPLDYKSSQLGIPEECVRTDGVHWALEIMGRFI